MNIIDFQRKLDKYQVFSLRDIEKIDPLFKRIQIDRWEKKGYIVKIKRGFYSLADNELSEQFLFFTANRIYSPSYISLEKALKFYGFIPEEVFQITSVSTKKTIDFQASIGNFSYRSIAPELFWGYRLMEGRILMAEPEKAILDYLYLHPEIKKADDFIEMRINTDSFHEKIDLKKFRVYTDAFKNKALLKRVKIFLKTIKND
jgi:predicted transcriptional regulator of viral defense system